MPSDSSALAKTLLFYFDPESYIVLWIVFKVVVFDKLIWKFPALQMGIDPTQKSKKIANINF
jgi:hypothetical protein